jgi:hypothetical protein
LAKMKHAGNKLAKQPVNARGAKSRKALSKDEMARQQGSDLPDREAMSLINANVAAPINAAIAANVLSDNSVAIANATQTAPITQTN